MMPKPCSTARSVCASASPGPLVVRIHHIAGQPLKPLETGTDAARGWIRDNTNAIQDWLSIGVCGRLLRMFSVRTILITAAVVAVVALLAIAAGSVWLNSFIHSTGF